MWAPILGGLLMLLPSDIGALQNSQLRPHAQNALASVADGRPVILARATYATYTSSSGGTITVMTATFLPYTLAPGDQIHAWLGGTAVNNSGAPADIGGYVKITQGLSSQVFGFPAKAPNIGSLTPFAWRSEIVVGVNQPSQDGQYVVSGMQRYANQKPTAAPSAPNSSIAFTGWGDTLIADTTNVGINTAGYLITGPGTGSALGSTRQQQVFTNDGLMTIDVIIQTVSSSNLSMTIQSGYLLGI